MGPGRLLDVPPNDVMSRSLGSALEPDHSRSLGNLDSAP